MKTILSKDKYQLLALLPSLILDAPSQFILKNVNLPFLLAFTFFQSTRQKLLVHNEGERYKIAGNWWDWKVRLSCGRTVCRVGDGKGRGYPPFNGGIWGPPLGKMFNWGFLKSVIQCTLSNQGKKFSHEDDTLFYPQVHQQNLSVGNQNLRGVLRISSGGDDQKFEALHDIWKFGMGFFGA